MWWTIQDYFSLYRGQIVLVTGVVAVVLVLALSFRDTVFGSEPPKPVACILLDVSGSTIGARDRYSAQTRSIVEEQSRKDGEVCAIAIKGDPEGQSHVDFWYVGAEHSSNSSSARLERIRQQEKAASAIDRMLQERTSATGGTALAEALNLVAGKVRPGDTIHVFSDGIQDSDNLQLRRDHKLGWPPARLDRDLDVLNDKKLLPDLSGVTVIFELPGERGPDAQKSLVPTEAAHDFWSLWAKRVNIRPSDFGWGTVPETR